MAQHIVDYFEDKARAGDGSFAIAFAVMGLADAQQRVATALRNLGMADAATPFGAIEALNMQIKEAGELIADALNNRDD